MACSVGSLDCIVDYSHKTLMLNVILRLHLLGTLSLALWAADERFNCFLFSSLATEGVELPPVEEPCFYITITCF